LFATDRAEWAGWTPEDQVAVSIRGLVERTIMPMMCVRIKGASEAWRGYGFLVVCL